MGQLTCLDYLVRPFDIVYAGHCAPQKFCVGHAARAKRLYSW